MKDIAHRIERTVTFVAKASPETVFPLLCPVLEYKWISFWKCRMVYSQSGVAEKDCVFHTDMPHRGGELWVCHLYEPSSRIGYLRFGEDKVTKLEIFLTPQGEETQLSWVTTYTGMGQTGEAYVTGMTRERYELEVLSLARMLNHYLETGECLHDAALSTAILKGE